MPLALPPPLTLARRAATSLYSTYSNPGVRGPKSFWYLGWPVAVIAVSVRPWKEFTAVMMTGTSMLRRVCACLRASCGGSVRVRV